MHGSRTPLLVVTTLLGAAGVADAAFVGLSTSLVAQPTIEGVDYDVYRVYVELTDPMDTVEAVTGNPANPVIIAGGGLPGFYQNVKFGSDVEPNMFLFWEDPNLEWDTFVTIGTSILVGMPVVPTQLIFLDTPGFECDRLTVTNGGWYRLPGDPITLAGDDLQVLIGQFTIPRGADLSGRLRVVGEFDGIGQEVIAELPLAVCPADVNGDRQVDVDDLIAVILAAGPCSGAECPCPDVNRDDVVDVDDLIGVILAWGACDG